MDSGFWDEEEDEPIARIDEQNLVVGIFKLDDLITEFNWGFDENRICSLILLVVKECEPIFVTCQKESEYNIVGVW